MLLVNLRKESGSITAIAVMMLMVFGIVLAGLLPYTKEVGRSAAASTELLSAQYVAEAGIKRAIVGFLKNRDDWDWIGDKVPLANGSWSADTYEVSISPNIENHHTAEGDMAYIITSIGRAGGRTQKVSCKVNLPLVTKTVTTKVPVTGELAANLPNGTIYIGGDLLVKNNFCVNGDVVCGGKIITHNGKSFNGSGSRLQNQTGLTFPSYDLDDYNGYKTAATALPTITSENQNFTLGGGLYYVDGDFNIDKNNINYNFSQPTVIFVENDVVISGNSLNMNGNVMIIALGRIRNTNGSNNLNMTSAVMVAGGGVDFENGNNINVGGQVVSKGNLNLKNNENFNARSDLAGTFNDITKGITIWKETQTTETGKDYANMSIYDWNAD